MRVPIAAAAAAAATLVAALARPPMAAGRADPPPRPRVGVLFWHDSPGDRETLRGVRDGFALAGMEPRFEVVEAAEDDARAREALRDFEARGLDLVYALGTAAALRARDEVRRVPVVFAAVTDPVGSGVVATEAGSGRNLCGSASGIAPADAVAVFRTAVPGLRTLGVVHDPGNPVSSGEVRALAAHGRTLVPPLSLKVVARDRAALAPAGAVRAAAAEALSGADALWIPIDIAVYSRASEAGAAAAAVRRPVVATAPAAARDAAAACVAADFFALGRGSVVFAARVLRGEDPGRLPVRRPRAYRVIVNLEAARRGGLEVPLPLLAAADEFAGVAGGR
jgi:putative ABC transport system substrate-binding protein